MAEHLVPHGYGEGREGGRGGDDGIVMKIQSENDFLRERLRSCEKAFVTIYQLLHKQDKPASSPRILSYRSASQHGMSVPAFFSPKSDTHGNKMEDFVPRQVTIPELKEAVQRVIRERSELASQVEDCKQVTEAAKRERVLAIDEKDKLLHSSHLLKVALERKEGAMKDVEAERDDLARRCRQLEAEVMSLRHANEQAMEMHSVALEERSKVIEERNQLKHELNDVQCERDELFEDKVHLNSLLQELSAEKSRSLQRIDWLSSRCSQYEAIARNLKEQNEVLNERQLETLTVTMHRLTPTQPWGFSIEGGCTSEFFHRDPSVVVTGIAGGTPAADHLKFGDRLLSVEGQEFRGVTRKEAVEVLRSCDQLSLVVEVARALPYNKPQHLEVHIPGRKAFGFGCESKLFVSSVEDGSSAASWLQVGDEIVQIQGKPAVNIKLSHFKQILKSCKDGLTLAVHRLPDPKLSEKDSKSLSIRTLEPSLTTRLEEGQDRQSHAHHKPSNEFYQSYQAPGTPGSTMSGSSAGYHSSHSIPSCYSNLVSPVGQESKTGREPPCPVPDSPLSPRPASQVSGSQHSQQSGYETDQTGLAGYFTTSSLHQLPPRSLSVGQTGLSATGNGRFNFRSRYPYGESYPTRPNLTSSIRAGQTNYMYDARQTGLVSPRLEMEGRSYQYPIGSSLPRYYRRRTHSNPSGPGGAMQQLSASFDHLEYRRSETEKNGSQSHGGHMTPTATPTSANSSPRQALSMSNMQCGGAQHSRGKNAHSAV